MYSELDDWTPHGDINDVERDNGLDVYNPNAGMTLDEVLEEQAEDRKRAAFIKGLLDAEKNASDEGTRIYFDGPRTMKKTWPH